jgi:VanZ family protein
METNSPPLRLVTERWLLVLVATLVVAYTLAPFGFSFPPTELLARMRAMTALPTFLELFKLGGHVVGFCILGGLFAAVYETTLARARQWHFVSGAAAFCLTLELMQFFAEGRHARLTDLICNFSGLCLGARTSVRWPRIRAVRAVLIDQGRRHSIRIQNGILALGAVIWFGAGLYPATGVLRLDWDKDFHLVVGNETDGNESWLGEIQYLGIYTRALDPQRSRMWCQGLERNGPESGLLVGYDFTVGKTNEVVPTGLLSTENLGLDVPLDSTWTASGGGILLAKPSLLSSRGPDFKLTEAIMAAGEFSLAAAVRPLHRSQTGPARIVSLSDGIWSRNFMLGQEKSDLVFRVRNGVNGTNGLTHALRMRDAVHEGLHEIVAVYDHGVSFLAMDGSRLSPVVDLREPGAYLKLGTGEAGRGIGALLLTLAVALPAVTTADRLGFGRWRHVLAVAVTFCVGSLPYAATCLWVGGRWRWAQVCWLIAVPPAVYPLCFWYAAGRKRLSGHF